MLRQVAFEYVYLVSHRALKTGLVERPLYQLIIQITEKKKKRKSYRI